MISSVNSIKVDSIKGARAAENYSNVEHMRTIHEFLLSASFTHYISHSLTHIIP